MSYGSFTCPIIYVLYFLYQETLLGGYKSYVADHPELEHLLSDFVTALLVRKPINTINFAITHFSSFEKQKEEDEDDDD